MRLRVVLEPSEDGGFTAIVPSLPGCISEGETKQEALKNAAMAIRRYLHPVGDDMGFAPDAEVFEIAM